MTLLGAFDQSILKMSSRSNWLIGLQFSRHIQTRLLNARMHPVCISIFCGRTRDSNLCSSSGEANIETKAGVQEVQALAVCCHPHIVRYHSNWMEQHNKGEHLFIQLECCDISLGSKLTLGDSFREGDLLKILRQVQPPAASSRYSANITEPRGAMPDLSFLWALDYGLIHGFPCSIHNAFHQAPNPQH